MDTAADTAHELRNRVRTYLAQDRASWVPLACALHAVHTSEAWRELATDSFSDWMAEEDIGRSRGYLLVSVWETFPDAEVLRGTDLSKFIWVVGPVRRGELNADAALADVRTLSRSDLRAKYGTTTEQDERENCPTCGQPLPRGMEL
jgi:hypothetical protein